MPPLLGRSWKRGLASFPKQGRTRMRPPLVKYALAFHGAPRFTGALDSFVKPETVNA
jgi:hypothetical protein